MTTPQEVATVNEVLQELQASLRELDAAIHVLRSYEFPRLAPPEVLQRCYAAAERQKAANARAEEYVSL